MNESTVNNPILKENESTRAILAGVDTGEYDAEISMDELEELAETAGAVTVCRIIQKRYRKCDNSGRGQDRRTQCRRKGP